MGAPRPEVDLPQPPIPIQLTLRALNSEQEELGGPIWHVGLQLTGKGGSLQATWRSVSRGCQETSNPGLGLGQKRSQGQERCVQWGSGLIPVPGRSLGLLWGQL